MTSYPVIVYHSSDPGAPQLDRSISSFFNILQKVLVEGYGDKAPLGWTRSYYDAATFKSAWRNNTAAGGSGGSVYFYSVDGTDSAGKNFTATYCKSIDVTGTTVGLGKTLVTRFDSSSSTDWTIIGNGYAFYFFCYAMSGTTSTLGGNLNRVGFFAGDIYSTIPNDAGRFVYIQDALSNQLNITSVTGINTISISNVSLYPESPAYQGAVRMWDADNGGTNTQLYALIGWSQGITGTEVNTPTNLPLITRPFIIGRSDFYENATDRLGVHTAVSQIRPSFRGTLPGALSTIFPVFTNEPLPLIIEDSGVSYFVAPVNSSSSRVKGSAFLVRLGEWYDPLS